MVKHIILWKVNEEVEDKDAVKKNIKKGLEGLKGVIPGLIEIQVITEGLASSNMDLMLDSSFESEAALNGYTIHPAHMDVATNIVRPFVSVRSCFDYEV
ncbi:MAG: Dabb family protein [Lachnospiraceae bacterium]|nr:Dabb family protein [Lachnospiraceae bacterium]